MIDLYNGEVISYNLSRHPVFAQVVDMLGGKDAKEALRDLLKRR